jgi:hypothetical protein
MPLLERCFVEYVILPAYLEPDEVISLWRFSCAGFVLKAYEEANLHLLQTHELPLVTLETLKRAYPRMAKLLDREEVRERLGIGRGVAWPAVLPGYIVNSMSRTREEIVAEPYRVQVGDEFFPRRLPAIAVESPAPTS